MKAIALYPSNSELKIIDVNEPSITQPSEVKIQVMQVGICGTDREEVNGGRVDAPQGSNDLIIGHEMIGRVVEVGSGVRYFKVGDYAIVTVRRGCGRCPACRMSRYDMCLTGEYKERGIKELNGFQTEFVVDQERFMIKVPASIIDVAVMTEPFSIVQKAIDEVMRIQIDRLPSAADPGQWMRGRQVLVAGLGPVGLLAALALRLREARVLGMDIVDENTPRPQILKELGGEYINSTKLNGQQIKDKYGQIDILFDATGIVKPEFDLMHCLGINGAYVITGIPCKSQDITIDGAEFMRNLVLRNQVLLGSVNASEAHFQRAVDDLEEGNKRWPGVIQKFITHRIPFKNMHEVLTHHSPDEIKAVIEWAN
ncbi:MAG: glucose 1-dehydrogenase [Chlamydiia bacterium]|nr:glucose 1-dehydrogenase [Chlamydiia bacterium]